MTRFRLTSLAALLLLVTAFSASSVQAASKLNSLQYVGVVEDGVYVNDYAAADATMALVKDAGFNAVKFFMEPNLNNPNGLDQDQLLRACNAAKAAEKYGIALFVDVMQDRDEYPSKNVDYQEHYNVALYSLLVAFKRCAPTVKHYDVELWNEPNITKFLNLQQIDAAGQLASSMAYDKGLASSYPSLKGNAGALGLDVNIIGGVLSPGRFAQPFVEAMGRAKTALGIKGPLMDSFSFHPYEDPGHMPGDKGSKGFSRTPALWSAAKKVTEASGLIYSEFGVDTQIPPAMSAARYSGSEPSVTRALTESQQVQYVTAALKLAAAQGARGIFLFHLYDECDLGAWQSGLYYCPTDAKGNPQPAVAKSSLAKLRPILKAAWNGGLGV